jgi:Na+/proline symporter
MLNARNNVPDTHPATRRVAPASWGSLAIISVGVASVALGVVPAHDRSGLFYALIGACGVAFVTTIVLASRAWKYQKALHAGEGPTTVTDEARGARLPPRLAIVQGAAIVYALLAMCTIVAGISLRSIILAVVPSLVCLPILGGVTYWVTRTKRGDEAGQTPGAGR